jgi:hypothetical protein
LLGGFAFVALHADKVSHLSCTGLPVSLVGTSLAPSPIQPVTGGVAMSREGMGRPRRTGAMANIGQSGASETEGAASRAEEVPLRHLDRLQERRPRRGPPPGRCPSPRRHRPCSCGSRLQWMYADGSMAPCCRPCDPSDL